MIAAARRTGRWVTRRPQPLVRSRSCSEAARDRRAGRLGELVGVDVFQGAEVGEADKQAARAPTGARSCRAACSTTWRRIRST